MKVFKASQKMWTVHYPFSRPVGHRTRSMGFKAERPEALREGVCQFFLINVKFICTLLGTHYWNSHGTGKGHCSGGDRVLPTGMAKHVGALL